MIVYSSSEWRTLLRVKGSVFPRAAKFAVFSAVLGAVLKSLENEEILMIRQWKLLTQSTGFSLFSATLAFVLVFRTSQCYSRFWHCASSVSTMRAQLSEAASSLVIFTNMSKASKEEVAHFRHKIVRLVSLLHATCLAVFCDRDVDFEVLDMDSFIQDDLKILSLATGKMRVNIVYTWINALIIKSHASGLLNVPPPILSRVFQEMEKSMVEFHQVQQVMSIPFPFPYAQMAVVLLMCTVFWTPLIMCYWTDHATSTACLTFIAILCLVSLELIADELDNPFGEDDNDLPCSEFQGELNSSLVLLVSDVVNRSPELSERSLTTLAILVKQEDLPPELAFKGDFKAAVEAQCHLRHTDTWPPRPELPAADAAASADAADEPNPQLDGTTLGGRAAGEGPGEGRGEDPVVVAVDPRQTILSL